MLSCQFLGQLVAAMLDTLHDEHHQQPERHQRRREREDIYPVWGNGRCVLFEYLFHTFIRRHPLSMDDQPATVAGGGNNGHLGVGGVEKSLVDLLRALDYTKYEVDLLLLEAKGVLNDRLPSSVLLQLLH